MSQPDTSLLLVEDDDALREVLLLILTQAGYAVRWAKDGFGALRAIREQVPAILLSDLYMPGMSGFELLYVVCVRYPAIRVVGMSGAFPGPEVPQGVDAEAFYRKGSDPGRLLECLQRMREQPRAVPAAVLAERVPWVMRSGYDVNGEEYTLLSCSECLRSFPVRCGAASPEVQHTECLHCRHLVGYRLVQGAGPAAKPAFLMSLKRALPGVALRA